MIITLLCIAFSSTLNFDGLTLVNLFDWYTNHPFLFMFAISECLHYTVNINKRMEG